MIIAKDKMKLNDFSKFDMPELHGHVKITLRNVHNGKTETVEGDNIITDAVKDIMKANWLGGIDYSKMFPLWQKWFGGVLCFENAFPIPTGESDPDPSTYYPLSSVPLTAHAGQTTIDNLHDDDVKRGNPLNSSYTSSANSMKMVWEWGSTRGNGTIRSLSLCHSDTGSYGLGSDTYNFKNDFEPLDVISQDSSFWNSCTVENDDVKNFCSMYDDTHGVSYTVGAPFNQTTPVYVSIRKLAYTKAGLHETLAATSDYEREFTVTAPISFFYSPCWYFDRTNKYLWLFHNLHTDDSLDYDPDDGCSLISYCIIDCENEILVNLGTVEDPVYKGTIKSDAADIAPLGVHYDNTSILKIGDYFYFPISSNPSWQVYGGVNVKGYKKINITNTSDQTRIDFNDTQKFYQTCMGNSDIFPNSGRVINGNTGYTCKPTIITTDNAIHNYSFSTPDLVSTYAQPIKIGTNVQTITRPQYILVNKLVLCSKYNLPSAITKTTSQSMRVEYTLTQS